MPRITGTPFEHVGRAGRRSLSSRARGPRSTGHLERRDGRYRFVAIELDARMVTEPGHERDALRLRVEVDVAPAAVPAA